MTRRVADIAAELKISEDQVRNLIAGLGLRVGRTAGKVNDDVAARVVARAKGLPDPGAAPAGRTYGHRRASDRRSEVAAPEDGTAEGDDLPGSKIIELPTRVTVKELAERMHVKSTAIITALMRNGVLATINDVVDYDTAAIVAGELGFEPQEEFVQDQGIVDSGRLKELLAGNSDEGEEHLVPRPPVIAVIGHVDHGKTLLLDTIRGTDVMSGEAGGITQRIGAYQVEHKGRKITFLDTPGHEAFSAMRARGVKSTDIAILVIAADDGVKEQTVEAISHARQAKIPFVIAITKTDKPDANPMRVKQQLTEHDILVEEFGGTIVCAEVSSKQKKGIDELLDLVLLVADMENLRADPLRPAIASVIESRLDQNLGPVASVLVHTGTLRLRDPILIGASYGRVKLMIGSTGLRVTEAIPSTPVLLAGFSSVPRAGDLLQVMESEHAARVAAEFVEKQGSSAPRVLADVSAVVGSDDGIKKDEYRIVVKGDLRGSLEALRGSLERLVSDTVQVKIVHMGVGDVTDSDILLASAAKADIFAFNVRIPAAMVRRADGEGIHLASYNVIYQLVGDVEGKMNKMLAPERIETPLGKMRLLKIFFRGKGECVVGGDVTHGIVRPKSHARVYRGEHMIGEGDLTEVRRGPEIVHEAQQGEQCGVRFIGNLRINEGDILDISSVELRERKVVTGPRGPASGG